MMRLGVVFLVILDFVFSNTLILANAQQAPPDISQIAQNEYSSSMDKAIAIMATNLTEELADRFKFCFIDLEEEKDRAFNFSEDTDFINACILESADMSDRLCSAAEIKFYFDTYLAKLANAGGLPVLNRNCNTKSWNLGCEPGWASALSLGANIIDNQNNDEIPPRTANPRPCCEGFFCPARLTCMIPCPLGAYCPRGNLNSATGKCDPYTYSLPFGTNNHSCGGADLWADVGTTKQIFCSAGFYCPSNTQKEPCSSGNYCRLGSTSQNRCYPLINCDKQTVKQNIFAYGILLIVTVVALLLLLYTCSDHILVIRERRRAKSREAAALAAKGRIKARERWRLVRETVREGAHKLKERLQCSSPASNYGNSIEEQELLRASRRIYSDDVDMDSSSFELSTLDRSMFESSRDHCEIDVISIDSSGEVDKVSGLNFGPSKGKKSKVSAANTAQGRTHLLEYAYGEIEKEKIRQMLPMTLTDVIQQAGACGLHSRPKIEVKFKELSLTLKGNGKRVLNNVTGSLMPGRIAAVMGPSGAGKTSLLNALAGKATGCITTGSIFLNDKPDSIHSYKKIVGFVPQDDIVHGNLTVEENLWFSAKCRLPVTMPKAELVLVVERVIQSLGLQAVRDSLVGTVERRGISGGQRKRVNVGLEVVIQPSLLFLDEPTSGLDSTSSLLLLKALRREALEGSNICMVLHQPSFALFRMFDDLKLLAKGGQTVYDGPVDELEHYFSTLGIFVPDRINPPDYFMDILEGITKPEGNLSFDCKILPLKWREYNGYEIVTEVNDERVMKLGIRLQKKQKKNQSFLQDLWEEIYSKIYLKWDNYRENFATFEDLSNRQTPNFFTQFRFYFERCAKQRFRESSLQAKDYLILMLGGACLGMLANAQDENFGIVGYTHTLIALPLLSMISALRTFSLDKLQYWRESSAGMSKVAYFLAKDIVDLSNTTIKPLVYLATFYFFSNPRSTFLDNYVVTFCLTYCVVGMAYIFAVTLDPAPAQLCSALFPVVFTLIATQTTTNPFLIFITKLTFSRWALEAYTIVNVERYSGVWLISRCGYLLRKGYDLNYFVHCLLIMVGFGILYRLVAFVCLIALNRKRQR